MPPHRRAYVRKRELPWAAIRPDLPNWPTLAHAARGQRFRRASRISVERRALDRSGALSDLAPVSCRPEHLVVRIRARSRGATVASQPSRLRASSCVSAVRFSRSTRGFTICSSRSATPAKCKRCSSRGPCPPLARPTPRSTSDGSRCTRFAPEDRHFVVLALPVDDALDAHARRAAGRQFERFMTCFARMLAGTGAARQPRSRSRHASRQARHKRSIVESHVKKTRSMVDERTAGLWATLSQLRRLEFLGLDKPPQHAVAGAAHRAPRRARGGGGRAATRCVSARCGVTRSQVGRRGVRAHR